MFGNFKVGFRNGKRGLEQLVELAVYGDEGAWDGEKRGLGEVKNEYRPLIFAQHDKIARAGAKGLREQ